MSVRSQRMGMRKASPSVLIIRLDGIGDALALTPLLAALRRRGIATDVVLRRANAGVFAAAAVRRAIAADRVQRSREGPAPAAIEELGRELRGARYSHVLVATEDPGGYRLARAVGAPVRVGFADPWGKPFKTLWSRRLLTSSVYRSAGLDRRGPHECEVLFRLASPLLGSESPTRDAGELRPLLLEREPPADGRVAIQITEKWPRLGIESGEVVLLVARLAAARPVHLIAAAHEAAYAQQIARSTDLEISYFDALEPWKAAVGGAAAIVTPDSGALHVAGMTGTPVVAVFAPQRHYALQVARWAPWAAPHRIVRADEGWPQRAGDALAQLLSSEH